MVFLCKISTRKITVFLLICNMESLIFLFGFEFYSKDIAVSKKSITFANWNDKNPNISSDNSHAVALNRVSSSPTNQITRSQ